MSAAARSVFYFSLYLLVAGLGLFLAPNQVLSVVGLASTNEVWVRLVGALTFILGVFFNYMARQNSRPFSYVSLYGRGIFIVAILIAVIFYRAPLALLLFAAVDLAGLLWTLTAYKKEH
jgi:uncharacterized protein YjeT (DUF2065 family)